MNKLLRSINKRQYKERKTIALVGSIIILALLFEIAWRPMFKAINLGDKKISILEKQIKKIGSMRQNKISVNHSEVESKNKEIINTEIKYLNTISTEQFLSELKKHIGDEIQSSKLSVKNTLGDYPKELTENKLVFTVQTSKLKALELVIELQNTFSKIFIDSFTYAEHNKTHSATIALHWYSANELSAGGN
jgi:hypothetical protein